MNKFKQIVRSSRKERIQRILRDRAFYNVRSILGNDWATFFILLGGAQAGKSYSLLDHAVLQWQRTKEPFYWLRLTERQSRQLLQNNAEKLVDPDLRRKYNLDLVTSGTNVYHVTKRSQPDKNGKTKILKKEMFCRVLCLSTFYADKGNGYFDKDNDNIVELIMDEFQPEKGEKRTFDIVYAFVRQLENIRRNKMDKTRVFMAANLLEEASDILCCFNFIPEQFGRYKIKKKRAVIDYIEPSEAYKEMRKNSIAQLLLPDASEYSNKIDTDYSLVNKSRLTSPQYIVKFSKNKEDWFTIWNGNVIKKWNGEKKQVVAMLPYLDELFNVKVRDGVISNFDMRAYSYRDLITFKQFQKNINLIKPRGN